MEDYSDSFDFLFKIILVGDAGVGKTCIVQRFKNGIFIERQANTIGVDFTLKTIMVDGKKIKLQIWDTAGQERFRTITQSYYRSTHGVIIGYDITKRESFTNVTRWLSDVKKFSGEDVMIILIGTKLDLVRSDIHLREVDVTEVKQFVKNYQVLDVLETSSKEDTNIDTVFQRLARALKSKHERKGLAMNSRHDEDTVAISSEDTRQINSAGCNC
ncbi:ras-related protein Rab-43-like [Dysidea avara]|uniref:ras-related protein Rab-43-like n=1 Tax=Dysidea avara TaxID=196820 RepID=UPI00332E38D6